MCNKPNKPNHPSLGVLVKPLMLLACIPSFVKEKVGAKK